MGGFQALMNLVVQLELAFLFESGCRIAVVTGGNKRIGFEICRQLASNGISVVLTARDVKRGNDAVEKLNSSGLADVSEIASSQSLKEIVKQTYESEENCLRTNYYRSKQVTKALIPLFQQSNSARIVNLSSSLAQLRILQNEGAKRVLGDVGNLTEEKIDKVVEEFLGDVKENLVERKGWPTNYSACIVSKAALNAFGRILARQYPRILINSVDPGYVSTDANNNTGPMTVEEGAKGPVMLALMQDGGASGLFFNQMEVSSFLYKT
ncbi:(+)-neomenthol dehydrogenase-like [Mangifera indica]|uniref:(+)-neomenthol dehydrogenase-like n=1 Tax=Mangifera indica TaxID=29780 RepID=UPI001CF99F13|nr:(+)-neomenthol dehydrogenase-like [Mangifera indica]